ncbi:MAG: lysoplasmalogenase [Anaerolineales bacterium]
MSTGIFGIALGLAIVDWIAVAQHNQRREYIFKPATLIAIWIGAALLAYQGTTQPRLARYFLLALIFSLAGDVFLMLPDEPFFLPGLVAFFLAHVSYILGLTPTLPPAPALRLLIVIAPLSLLFYQRIAAGLRTKQQEEMLLPTAAYTLILSLMLWAAWATLFRPGWTPAGRALAITGATLFFASDAMLAWDRFVHASAILDVAVIITYHLAQIALALVIGVR